MIYRYLPFILTLEAPAVITAFGGDPNSSRTLSYLPGSILRGAAAKKLGDPGNDPKEWKKFRNFILGGKVRWLNAYPVSQDLRALPVPESFRCQKDASFAQKADLIDLACFKEDWPEEQLERVSAPFITFEANPLLIQPKIGARLHHQRDRIKGRAWKDSSGQSHGTIFIYEYLEADQQFEGLVQLKGESEEKCLDLAEEVKKLLGEMVFIGRSKRARYGGAARITWKDLRETEIEGPGGDGLRPLLEDILKGQRFRLFLIADAVVRHPETGQIDPQALPLLIESIFKGRVRILFKALGSIVRSGFNRKWRLEIPQALAVKAGAVLLLEAKEGIPKTEINSLLHEGIGERREEGFGRFVLLDESVEILTVRLPSDSEDIEPPEDEVPEEIFLMERRILLKHARLEAIEKGLEIAQGAQNIPSNSLLGRLSTPLRKPPSKALDTLRSWLTSDSEEERLKKEAMEQLERCTLLQGNKNLKCWLEEILRLESLSELLNLDVLAQRYHLVSEENARKVLLSEKECLASWLIEAVFSGLRLRNKLEEEDRG
ncbi:MAG: hypothetical protein GXO39_05565 [Thermotogae bacterium]|nr:hypothetical protein [Thermotogota bacterium]